MRNFREKLDNTAPAPSGILTAAEDNVCFSELEALATSAGITLDGPDGPDTNLQMLAEATARYASGGVFCQDTGAANAHVLGTVGTFVLPNAYFKGMMVVFYPSGTNTGAATANVGGIGSKPIYNSAGGALAAGDIVIQTLTMMSYDPALNSGNGAFKLSPWSMPMRSVGEGTAIYEGLAAGRHKIRSLMAGSNITLDLVQSPASSGEYKIRITASGGGGGGTLTDGDKGDIVVTSSGTVWTVDAKAVSNDKLADMGGNTLKGRLSTTGEPQNLTGTQVMSILPDCASGVKGATTPNGNVAQFLNGLGAYSTPAASFPLYPNAGSYTVRVAPVSSGTYPVHAVVAGESKNATGSGSWLSTYNITLPAGVWQAVCDSIRIDQSFGSGAMSETVGSFMIMFQRTA